MLYLTTGANGACKTLMTLHDVREQQVKENRPVFYHGFEPVKEIIEDQFGWRHHDPEKWMDLPDGSILLWDEAQTYLGSKRWGTKEVPQWVLDLGVYRRKRGFDIWVICPHPSMLHVDVRRLIANPSWHRHFKRMFGAEAANEYRFHTPNLKCEEATASEDGESRVRKFPKHVYGWYKSAEMHTAKRRIPRAVFVAIACALAVPVLGWVGYSALHRSATRPAELAAAHKGATAAGTVVASAPSQSRQEEKRPMTAAEYVAARMARVPGLPYTAPAYDEVAKPAVAPYPAMCIYHHTSHQCDCYTQQATKLDTPQAVCEQIALKGIFIDWRQEAPAREPVAMAPSAAAREVPFVADGSSPTGQAGQRLASDSASSSASVPEPASTVASGPPITSVQMLRRRP